MIGQTVLLWLGTMALLADYVALRTDDLAARAVGLATGLLMFAFFAMHATGYQITTNAGVVIRQSDLTLALFGVLAAGGTLVLLIETGFRAMNQ